MSDDTIDTDDIPEAPPENWRYAFRPNRRGGVQVDPDILSWFAARFPGGEPLVEINRVLRAHVAEVEAAGR